ncbi:hypothetical protein AAMO2058_000464000 [Amorphochlora amoebiformis]|mmetsp:Transcript_13958/g.22087  ORF Transcript_13958/g.22087 Transcript_13958/m.22087 type:complete len:168 (-) Transcript_13958:171-674(-)
MPRDQPIHKAAKEGKEDTVLDLLKEGVSVDERGAQNRTPLHQATGKKFDEVVKILIDHKADVSLTDKSGYTALHWAAMFDSVECAKLLVAASADINCQSKKGDSALHLAGEKDNLGFVTYATSLEGVDITLKNHAEQTPYLAATKAKCSKETAALLKVPGGGCCTVM